MEYECGQVVEKSEIRISGEASVSDQLETNPKSK